MIKSLWRRFQGRDVGLPDAWGLYKSLYVASFKEQLEEIARLLSDDRHTVSVSLNPEQKCAEFRDETGWTVARVNVHGEMGLPYKAIVRTMLSPERYQVFRQLSVPVDFICP